MFLDFFTLPIKLIFDHDTVNQLGLTSLRDKRINLCLKYCSGKVLDIGCGEGNRLIRKWGNGIGVDVYPWEGVDKVCDTRNLPFKGNEFDTVTIVAALGHIPERREVLQECFRVLKPNGRILITELSSVMGFLRHKLAWWDKDLHERGMKKGEVYGMSQKDVKILLEGSGFRYKRRIKFVYGLNNLYIGEKLLNVGGEH